MMVCPPRCRFGLLLFRVLFSGCLCFQIRTHFRCDVLNSLAQMSQLFGTFLQCTYARLQRDFKRWPERTRGLG